MRVARIVAVVAGLFLVALGLWAFFATRSFYDSIATYPPYNRHLLHDIGAFQLGLGATLIIASAWANALGAALAGNAVAAVMHEAAHVWDRDLGGRSSDPYFLAVVAVVIVGAAVLAARERA